MQRPTWGTVMGVIFILSGLNGIFNGFSDANVEKYSSWVDEKADEFIDSTAKSEEMDSVDTQVISMFGDSIYTDAEGNVDMQKTVKSLVHVSDYRKSWMVKFAYMAIGLGILLIIGGVLLFKKTKSIIPVCITTLVLCIAFALLKLFVFAADLAEQLKAIIPVVHRCPIPQLPVQ